MYYTHWVNYLISDIISNIVNGGELVQRNIDDCPFSTFKSCLADIGAHDLMWHLVREGEVFQTDRRQRCKRYYTNSLGKFLV
jgi:hypothetical protein